MTTSADDGLLTGQDMTAWLAAFAERVIRDVETLTDLDRRAGDGDFGWNISSALERVTPLLADGAERSPAEVLETVSESFLGAGGTSGALFGLWFGRLAKGAAGAWTSAELARVVDDATAAVQRLGGAQVGHKTMVDAMVPATAALNQSTDLPWRAAVAQAAEAAAAGAASTEQIIAVRGRASYVGERARGVIDPGALAVAWFFAAAEGGAA